MTPTCCLPMSLFMVSFEELGWNQAPGWHLTPSLCQTLADLHWGTKPNGNTTVWGEGLELQSVDECNQAVSEWRQSLHFSTCSSCTFFILRVKRKTSSSYHLLLKTSDFCCHGSIRVCDKKGQNAAWVCIQNFPWADPNPARDRAWHCIKSPKDEQKENWSDFTVAFSFHKIQAKK